MFERLEALEAAVRRIQAAGTAAGWLVPDPPPPLPTEDPDKARLDYANAQAEVKNQQDRAKVNIEAAESNAKRAKEILDKSEAAAKVPVGAPHPPEQPAERRR